MLYLAVLAAFFLLPEPVQSPLAAHSDLGYASRPEGVLDGHSLADEFRFISQFEPPTGYSKEEWSRLASKIDFRYVNGVRVR